MHSRRPTLVDRWLTTADRALKTLFGVSGAPARPSPAAALPADGLEAAERRHAAALMRVNHAGEIAAQALYHGHGTTARQAGVRAAMREAAAEESDHLAWCAQRLAELDGRSSLLNPLWYAGSFAIGALTGLAGDRSSLGFVAETERQVVAHLADHLGRLPAADTRSRAILQQMRKDEAAHGRRAMHAGGATLPAPVRVAMRLGSRLFTRTAYWI
ncbi:MAG TPA: 2-polyprenyl-3-methyl-6-methoxy-1,4-benzoquinone monooxygenase [Gammaproteobacteria bacterium]|nr:2-polyprenyl-3-methyl-6-methoxy-1,4-benzoquinone monooxygenase [Gammaproteobacteria bacterium]